MSASAAAIGRAFARAHRERLVALCADLVAAPSEQPRGDTTAPAAVIVALLTEAGLSPVIVAASPSKPNVVCAIEGARPGPHLVFNGHLDTLNPGSEAEWSAPIRGLGRDNGRLTGLGVGGDHR